MEKKGITKDMTISDIIGKYPDTVEVFFKHGLHCLGCAASQFENVDEAARAHGIDPEKLIKDLNSKIKSKSKK